MEKDADIADYDYYLFAIDILDKPTTIFQLDLEEGQIHSICRIENDTDWGVHKVLKLAPQGQGCLSDLYIYDTNNDSSLVSFCKVTPEFITSLIKSSHSVEKEKSMSLFWDYYLDKRDKKYGKSNEIASIFKLGGGEMNFGPLPFFFEKLFSILKIKRKKIFYTTYYKDRPMLLYVEPKSNKTLSEEEMIDVIGSFTKKLNFFGPFTTVFTDSAVSSFFNNGSGYLNTSLVFLANSKLNDNTEQIKVKRFFWNIIGYIIAYHTLKKELDLISEHEKNIDNYIEDGKSLKISMTKNDAANYERFYLSILETRNSFNLLSSKINKELSRIREIDYRINESLKDRISDATKESRFRFVEDLSNKLKELLLSTEENLKIVNEKINLQTEFTSTYFQTLKTIDNIHLQRRIYSLSLQVFLLTIIILLFSQWNNDTILNLIIKLIKNIFNH